MTIVAHHKLKLAAVTTQAALPGWTGARGRCCIQRVDVAGAGPSGKMLPFIREGANTQS